MLMSDVFAIVFTILGFLLAFPALWLTLNALFPNAARRSEEQVREAPIRSFLVGAVSLTAIVFLVVLLAATQANFLKFIALLTGGGGAILAHLGVAGLVRHIGSRMPSSIDGASPWRAALRGAIALELSYLLPIAGWFLILPVSWLVGLGAATTAILRPAPALKAAPVSAPDSAAAMPVGSAG
ncbi:MAG: hypothetical protein HYY93_13115 [Planctomycetes bacterium]|nr:hypothetical protein [Planctomycetota bacterium]